MNQYLNEDITAWLDGEFERLDCYLRLAVLEKWISNGPSVLEAFGTGETFRTLDLDAAEKDPVTRLQAELKQLEAMRMGERQPGSSHQNAPIRNHLMASFELGRIEWDTMLTIAAPAIDPKYRTIYAWLQDHPSRCYPDQGLLLRLLARTRKQRTTISRFLSAHPVVSKFRLISCGAGDQLEAGMYSPGMRLISIFSGQIDLDPELLDCLFPIMPPANHTEYMPLQFKPIVENLVQELRYRQEAVSFRLLLQGDRGSGRQNTAGAIGAALGVRVLRVDLETLIRRDGGFYANLDRIVRELLLIGGVPLITHLDKLASPEAPYPAWRSHLLRTLNNTFKLVFILENETAPLALDEATEAIRHISVIPLRFPFPDLSTRTRAWDQALAVNGLPMNELEAEQLAGMFRFNIGRIEEAVRFARMLRLGDFSRPNDDLLLDACRGICNHKLTELAERVPCIFNWDDLILPPKARQHLQDLAAYFKHREALFDRWGFAGRVAQKGLHALFYGPPGTGKTMAASVIAAGLKLELYRIDLSRVVSKYIGETEKNLAAIFKEAREANAILFFDEADALFGKRSEVKDAQDRFANVEISYLLQQMESFDGVTILATNLLQNLDDAFTRRIKFIIELPFPETPERERLWRGMFPHKTPLSDDIDFEFLAERFPFSGGEIKNIALGAAAFAMELGHPIDMGHILYAIRMEKEKKGQFFIAEDFEPYAELAIHHPGSIMLEASEQT